MLLGLLLTAVSACSGSVDAKDVRSVEGSIPGLTVSGSFGSEPTVRMAVPLKVTRSRSSVVVTGTGAPVGVDQLFVLQLTLYDARTGRRAATTYADDGVPVVAKSSDDSLFPELTKAVVGQRQGSRVALALLAEDAYGPGGAPPEGVRQDDPVVVVADIVAVPPTKTLSTAQGRVVGPAAGDPRVEVLAGDPTAVVTVPGTEPRSVTVRTLVQGDGPAVRDHSLVTVDYLAQVWGSPVPLLDTYFKEPAVVPVGAEGSLPEWDDALVGVRRGSRVLILAPAVDKRVPGVVDVPDNGAIAWVVDVLGVS